MKIDQLASFDMNSQNPFSPLQYMWYAFWNKTGTVIIIG